ncbi:MAG TPA: hypothetical protein ENJ40_04520 [Thermosulfurimonas dismutans]|uniref:Uncharacterized protein n=1 Tax=Thermosulfurimonas dismutans TaxID=999894 RepID=A0A7C3CPL0_9BACT|nr:hypothetical protein [Thermosulfurimonas dismutans]
MRKVIATLSLAGFILGAAVSPVPAGAAGMNWDAILRAARERAQEQEAAKRKLDCETRRRMYREDPNFFVPPDCPPPPRFGQRESR